jgi:excisionase family DNA binding protein
VEDRRALLRASDLAGMLGISRGRVYQLIAQRTLPSVRIGRAIWIPVAALEDWLTTQAETALASIRGTRDEGEVGDR